MRTTTAILIIAILLGWHYKAKISEFVAKHSTRVTRIEMPELDQPERSLVAPAQSTLEPVTAQAQHVESLPEHQEPSKWFLTERVSRMKEDGIDALAAGTEVEIVSRSAVKATIQANGLTFDVRLDQLTNERPARAIAAAPEAPAATARAISPPATPTVDDGAIRRHNERIDAMIRDLDGQIDAIQAEINNIRAYEYQLKLTGSKRITSGGVKIRRLEEQAKSLQRQKMNLHAQKR